MVRSSKFNKAFREVLTYSCSRSKKWALRDFTLRMHAKLKCDYLRLNNSVEIAQVLRLQQCPTLLPLLQRLLKSLEKEPELSLWIRILTMMRSISRIREFSPLSFLFLLYISISLYFISYKTSPFCLWTLLFTLMNVTISMGSDRRLSAWPLPLCHYLLYYTAYHFIIQIISFWTIFLQYWYQVCIFQPRLIRG